MGRAGIGLRLRMTAFGIGGPVLQRRRRVGCGGSHRGHLAPTLGGLVDFSPASRGKRSLASFCHHFCQQPGFVFRRPLRPSTQGRYARISSRYKPRAFITGASLKLNRKVGLSSVLTCSQKVQAGTVKTSLSSQSSRFPPTSE